MINARTAVFLVLALQVAGAVLGADAPAAGAAQAKKPEDLPLVEIAAGRETANQDVLAVLLTGDGGWAAIDRALSAEWSAQGIATVGWLSNTYYDKARTPEEVARDLERILRYYLVAWKKERILLAGYSFGADVLPFAVNRLAEDLSGRVNLIALLGLEDTAAFQYHWLSHLGMSYPETDKPVMPEMEKLKGRNIVCVCGDGEGDSPCNKLPEGLAQVERFKGGHHFGGKYDAVADAILKHLKEDKK
jgi:type IV secretory pathway VirJ component